MEVFGVREKRYRDFTLKELFTEREPVQMKGFAPGESENIIRRLMEIPLLDYALANGNLSLERGIRSGRLSGATAERMRTGTAYYLSGVLARPGEFIPVPYHCERCFFFKSRVWISDQATRTPLHRDIPHNLMLVLGGEKRVRMVRPGNAGSVYAYSIFSRTPNFARLNLFEPDAAQFPRAEGLTVYEAILGKNDLLYIPPSWWHDVQSTQKTVSMNFWFAPLGGRAIFASAAGIVNRILGAWSRG